jgi:pilus assembly protein CpaB
MFFRRVLLALGAAALIAGIGLSLMWLRAPAPVVSEKPAIARQAVLVAARALPSGTLLRSDDVSWTDLPVGEIPPGSFARGQGDVDVLGAATRRAFRPGEPIAADQIIRPSDSGFLPAVLGPGMRAISLAVDPAEAGSGLIAPADHVDVILTQTLGGSDAGARFRAVGETILHDLRVIAIDQTTNLARSGEVRVVPAAPPHVPKTVTLEVSARQAETLTVAQQLGKLQLTLRSLADVGGPAAEAAPTWANEVSRALQQLAGQRASGPRESGPAAPASFYVIRGSKAEQRCFSPAGQPTACANVPGPVPGKASAVSPVRRAEAA